MHNLTIVLGSGIGVGGDMHRELILRKDKNPKLWYQEFPEMSRYPLSGKEIIELANSLKQLENLKLNLSNMILLDEKYDLENYGLYSSIFKINDFLSMLCKKQSKNGDKNTGKIRVIHKLSTKSG